MNLFFVCTLACSLKANMQSSDTGPASEIPKGFRFTEMEVSGIPRRVRIGHHYTVLVKNKGTVKQYIKVFLCKELKSSSSIMWDIVPYDFFNPKRHDLKHGIEVGPGKVWRFRWSPSQKLVSRFHLSSKNLKIMVENDMADSWGGPSFYSRTFQIVKR